MASPTTAKAVNHWALGAWIAGASVATALSGLLAGLVVAGPRGLVLTSSLAASGLLVVALLLLTLARQVSSVEGLRSLTVIVGALAISVLFHFAVVVGAADAPFPGWGTAAELLLLVSSLVALQLGSTRQLPSPVVLSAAVSLVAVGLLSLAVSSVGAGLATEIVHDALVVALWFGYLLAAAAVHRYWPWPDATRVGAVVAVVAMGSVRAVSATELTSGVAAVVLAELQVLTPALLCSMLYVLVRRVLQGQATRYARAREQLLEEQETARRQQIDRHAMRNMVAGLSMASELLDDELAQPIRQRLERTIQNEAEQLRLLLEPRSSSTDASPDSPPAQTTDRAGAPRTNPAAAGASMGESYDRADL